MWHLTVHEIQNLDAGNATIYPVIRAADVVSCIHSSVVNPRGLLLITI